MRSNLETDMEGNNNINSNSSSNLQKSGESRAHTEETKQGVGASSTAAHPPNGIKPMISSICPPDNTFKDLYIKKTTGVTIKDVIFGKAAEKVLAQKNLSDEESKTSSFSSVTPAPSSETVESRQSNGCQLNTNTAAQKKNQL